MTRRRHNRGFTLLEVVIALGILAISLGVMLQVQASSLDNAARARDITIATLLARSKLIDIEQVLYDDGFVEGETDDKGDFEDLGYPDIKWTSRVSEIDLDLAGLGSMCEGFGEDGGDAGGCDSMFGSFGGLLEGFVGDFGQSVRLLELTVEWPVGRRFTDTMTVTGVVTREDYALASGSPFTPQNAANTDLRGQDPRSRTSEDGK